MNTLLLWLPRAAGASVGCFLALFAFGAFTGHGRHDLATAIPAFFIHLLPATVVFLVVALAWRRPWIGALGLLALAALYAVVTRGRPDWVLVISGPLALTGLLYLASWRMARGTP